MDNLSNHATMNLARALVSSFSPQHYSQEIINFVDSVLESMSLSKEQRHEIRKNIRVPNIQLHVPGKYEISRIVFADLLPDLDYPAFIKSLETSSEGMAVLVDIQRFVAGFNNKYEADDASDDKSAVFHEYLEKIASQIASLNINNAEECAEYHLTMLLYDQQFPQQPTPEDTVLYKKISNLQFLTFEHLEIPRVMQERVVWDYACEALSKIHIQKTPRDKVHCIFECLKIIAKGLSDAGPGGADDLLPCVIYTLLKANVPQLHSNLNYINVFRSPQQMGSQSGYFCVTIYAAAAFIENLTSEQLAIDSDFFRSQFAPSSDDFVEDVLPHIKTLEQYMLEALPVDKLNLGDSPSNPSVPVDPTLFPTQIKARIQSPVVNDSTFLDDSLTDANIKSILLSLIAAAVSGKQYDARIRVALRRMTRKLTVSHTHFLMLEETFVRSLALVQHKPAAPSTATKTSLRIAKVLLAATAGGAVLALTGGLAAPIVGHFFGVIGLSALATALTTTTGVSGVALVGILCGAAVTGGQMARKTAGVEEFDFLRVQTRKVTSTSSPEEVPLHKPKTNVFDAIKHGFDDIVQKTKQKVSKDHAKPVDEAIPLAQQEPTNGAETAGELETTKITSISDKEGELHSAGHPAEDEAEKFEIFTEHVHKSAKPMSQDSHPVSSGESLVVGNHSTFKGLHAIVGIPGWANSDNDPCICEAWSRALHKATLGYGDSFVLMWESYYLKKIGTDIHRLQDTGDNQNYSLAQKFATKMRYHSLLSTTVLQEFTQVDSPWMLVRDRAEKSGILLAHALLDGSLGARPVTLIGVSMGARVIVHCLEELARLLEVQTKETTEKKSHGKSKTTTNTETTNTENTNTENTTTTVPARDPRGVVENVVFIGGAVPADVLRFASLRKLVAGRLVNCYNPEDYTLSVIYRTVHWLHDGICPPCGVAPVASAPTTLSLSLPIDNINVQPMAPNHMDYQKEEVLLSILESVGAVF